MVVAQGIQRHGRDFGVTWVLDEAEPAVVLNAYEACNAVVAGSGQQDANDPRTVRLGDGRYRVDNVPPGTYGIVAWNEGATSETRSVTVPDGGTAEIDFTIR